MMEDGEVFAKGLNACSREKYWNELSLEEKIERLREQVKLRDGQLDWLNAQLQALMRHQHMPDGSLAVSISQSLGSYMNQQHKDKTPYF